GLQRFAELGFPATRDEEWRFTNVTPITRKIFDSRSAPPVVSGLSKGVHLGTNEDAVQHMTRYAGIDRNAFVALNTAFLDKVTVIRIDRGAVAEQPIFLTYTNTGKSAMHPRVLILVGAGA